MDKKKETFFSEQVVNGEFGHRNQSVTEVLPRISQEPGQFKLSLEYRKLLSELDIVYRLFLQNLSLLYICFYS